MGLVEKWSDRSAATVRLQLDVVGVHSSTHEISQAALSASPRIVVVSPEQDELRVEGRERSS